MKYGHGGNLVDVRNEHTSKHITKGAMNMFVLYDKNENKKPIKVWLESQSDIEDACLEQANNLSKLPFIYKWVALMPDTHLGMGMPIGGVIATEGVIIPNAVGVDIGCGMSFVQTDIDVATIKETMTGNGTLVQAIIGDILRNIPVGFSHQKEAQASNLLDEAMNNLDKYDVESLQPEIEAGYKQLGTLGGGNHFIELQEDEDGKLCIMLHSGSRHFGHKVCSHFHAVARELNQQWFTSVPDEYRLAFLPVGSAEGKSYINWMNLALDFAYENRDHMMNKVMEILDLWTEKHLNLKANYSMKVNCHHNYAAIENHYGKNVWVHRKGAIRVREGDLGIIPGAMGSYSYIVIGKGNPESFHSASHGAGRKMSRKKAMESFSVENVVLDLREQEVTLGKRSKKDIPEESRFAYKDIDTVIGNELDLITPIKKLKTVGVVKG